MTDEQIAAAKEIREKEGAIHLLRNLVDNLDEDISSDEMTRHLKDALNDAKQFLGIEVNDEEHTDEVKQ